LGIVGLLDEISEIDLSSFNVVAELISMILVENTSTCGVIEEIAFSAISCGYCELAILD
jgi:hypothetical protein